MCNKQYFTPALNNRKMRNVLFLVTVLMLWSQNTEAKEITSINTYHGNLLRNNLHLIKTRELANLEMYKLLNINDLWDNIKTSVANAWNAIKNLASQTKDKINVWMQDLKKRAEEVGKVFEARLDILKNKLDALIQTIKDTTGDVKQCIQEDKEAIQQLLKLIALRVSSCIAESIKTASAANSHQSKLALDESEFMTEAEKKVNKCIENIDDSEDCLNKVRGEIYDEMEHTENGIMETRVITRNLADDALETILQCAADGIIDASGAITEEAMKIINCVINEKEKVMFMKLIMV